MFAADDDNAKLQQETGTREQPAGTSSSSIGVVSAGTKRKPTEDISVHLLPAAK